MIDLNNTWCEATEENFNVIINFYNIVYTCDIQDVKYYEFLRNSDGLLTPCAVSLYEDGSKQIHLVNGKFEYVKPKNNFKDYGFEADFKGEILKEYENQFVGMVYQNEGFFGCSWDKKGKCLQTKGFGYIDMDLKPIKKQWYENPDNFPCIVYSLKLNEYIVLDNHLVPLKLNDWFRPATKEEVLSLLIKEE